MDVREEQRGKKGYPESQTAGTFWRCTLIGHDHRLRVGRGIAKTERQASRQALAMLHDRRITAPPPALTSDSDGGHRAALLAVYGKAPVWNPTHPKPGPDWRYLQIVKHRHNGVLVAVKARVVYGYPLQVRLFLGEHVAYVERTHLTSRLMNSRLTRRTLGFSKSLPMLRASASWEDLVYNFARPLKTLRLEVNDGTRRWLPRSPALAAGLTDHLWSIRQLLIHRPILTNS